MNFKKIVISAFAGVSMLTAFVGTAPAATEVNIYGASSQYLYWNAVAPSVLTGEGCTSIQQATKDANNAVTKATCGANTVILRVSSKASYDGLESLLGNDSFASAGAANEKCSLGDPGYPGAALEGYYRKMVDETSCTTWGNPAPTANGGCSALKCVRVSLAVSDVTGGAFVQTSHGALDGPAGGAQTDRSFSYNGTPGIPTTGFTNYAPIVVPFAFYVNNAVQQDTNYPNKVYQTITNIPRIMAVLIYSGQAYNWTDFGSDFVPNLPIVACMRHAGSGTHATLDLAVMHGQWGGSLMTTQSAGGPTAWFNDKSSDEMNCVSGQPGAIGYSDADQALGSYPNAVRVAYNGQQPTRVNIRNGRYEFFTTEEAYVDPTQISPSSAIGQQITALISYASHPENIPTATFWGPDKTQYWASSGEMNYTKGTDFLYPTYTGASNPQLP